MNSGSSKDTVHRKHIHHLKQILSLEKWAPGRSCTTGHSDVSRKTLFLGKRGRCATQSRGEVCQN
jgi:hypothetical protein